MLCSLEVPFIKIGSGDADNVPLLKDAVETNKTLVISTGKFVFKTFHNRQV